MQTLYQKIKDHWFRHDLADFGYVGRIKHKKTGEITEIKWMYDYPVVILSNNEVIPLDKYFLDRYELITDNIPLTDTFQKDEMRISTILGLSIEQIQKMKDYFVKEHINVDELKGGTSNLGH